MLAHLLVVFTPLGDGLQGWLDVTKPAVKADYLVCLGGNDHRLIWAADLFHQGIAPYVVVSNLPGSAEKMRDYLAMLGVPADRILVDATSFNTGDHPAAIERLLQIDPASSRLVIVTDAMHSRRVTACFKKGGYRDFVVTAGAMCSDVGVSPHPSHRWRTRVMILPNIAYEYSALVVYWLQGRI